MTEQKILDNAPDGATHISDEFNYYEYSEPDWYFYHPNECRFDLCDSFEHIPLGLRSLSDIKRIAELEAQLKAAQPEWISVEDRLPKKEGRYLTKRTEFDCESITMFLPDFHGFGKNNRVGLWCKIPLPTPPEKGQCLYG